MTGGISQPGSIRAGKTFDVLHAEVGFEEGEARYTQRGRGKSMRYDTIKLALTSCKVQFEKAYCHKLGAGVSRGN